MKKKYYSVKNIEGHFSSTDFQTFAQAKKFLDEKIETKTTHWILTKVIKEEIEYPHMIQSKKEDLIEELTNLLLKAEPHFDNINTLINSALIHFNAEK